MLNITKQKQKYSAPELRISELTEKDILLSSKVEQRRQVIIDGGDWSGSLLGNSVEEIFG